MAAPTQDPEREFPDGITRQSIIVVVYGLTDRPGAAKGETVSKTPRREMRLDLDPGHTAYDAAGIEGAVIGLLNDVQGALARERGEDGF